MDLYNNQLARKMANSAENTNKTYDELFNAALTSGNLVTSLNQVADKFGFNPD